MAFDFPRRNPSEIFFPTVHVHDGGEAIVPDGRRLYAAETLRMTARDADPAHAEQNVQWARSLSDAVRAYTTGQVYVNYIGAGEARPRRGRRGNGVGERARPERLHRIGAIGMSMEVDEARKRHPGGLTGLFGRTNGRDRSFAQRHREHTAVPRQRNRTDGEFVGHHDWQRHVVLSPACGGETKWGHATR